ncbi:MAG TPA: hypothetical protein VEB66_15540 [Opitutaceae bacterium]|nr:hypothetical protein [Opitutaceae bacterium]
MAQQLQTTGFVLARQASTSDSFEQLTVFDSVHGILHTLQRIPKKAASNPPLDLFDEAELWLESSNQGRTWFIKEHRLQHRPAGLGRSYESLRCASALAALLLRNPVPDESREPIAQLLRQTFAALAAHPRADVVWLKTLFCFLRDEGYPVKQQWWQDLPAGDREAAALILNQPLAGQDPDAAVVARFTRGLEDWLHRETELRL